jgi:hypothetical protein
MSNGPRRPRRRAARLPRDEAEPARRSRLHLLLAELVTGWVEAAQAEILTAQDSLRVAVDTARATDPAAIPGSTTRIGSRATRPSLCGQSRERRVDPHVGFNVDSVPIGKVAVDRRQRLRDDDRPTPIEGQTRPFAPFFYRRRDDHRCLCCADYGGTEFDMSTQERVLGKAIRGRLISVVNNRHGGESSLVRGSYRCDKVG